MKRSLGTCGILSMGLALAGPASGLAADLTVTGPITISTPTTYDNVTVASGGTLTVDAPLTVNVNMTVNSGGVVTHTLRNQNGLVLNVAGTLTVATGGAINADARGLRGGGAGSSFGNAGEAFDPTGTTIVSGSTSVGNAGAGGSFGGVGATSNTGSAPNAAYGYMERADLLGAGGSRGGTLAGGHGGGRITINAGNLSVSGVITAGGGNGGGPSLGAIGGGGSGGSIAISVSGTFSGTSGASVQAAGGAGGAGSPNTSGSGGGGRMVIQYGTLTYPLTNLHVRGGNGGRLGGAGAIYLKAASDPTGELLVDNNNVAGGIETPFRTALVPATFKLVRVLEQGILGASAANIAGGVLTMSRLRVETTGQFNARMNLSLPLGSELELVGGALTIVTGTTFTLGNFTAANVQAGSLVVQSGAILDVTSSAVTVDGGVTLTKDGSFGTSDQITSMTVASGGLVTHSLRNLNGLVLEVTGTLTVDGGGSIDVTGRGLRGGGQGSPFGNAGEAFDPTGTTIVSGATSVGNAGGGASFGGVGATSNTGSQPNPAYGYVEDADLLGAGGARAGTVVGGNGGGRITITAGNLVMNGLIAASGGAPGAPDLGLVGGGGSGGSIFITVSGTFSGTSAANIQVVGANGATGGSSISGSGGGGRIVVHYATMTYPLDNLHVRGGIGTRVGAAGTLYLKRFTDATGELLVDNNTVASNIETPLRTNLLPATFRLVRVFGQGILGASAANIAGGTLAMDRLRIEPTGQFNVRMGLSLPLGSELELVGGFLNIASGAQLTLGTFDAGNAQSGAITIVSGGRLDVTSNTITVGSGVTLVKDGSLGGTDEIGTMTVRSGGLVTHSLRLVSGLVLSVTGTLDVQSGGLIDVSARGLRGGDQGSAFGVRGEAYDPTGTTIIAGANLVGAAGAGASYGGAGATSSSGAASNAPYGMPQTPQHLGSGGAGASDAPVGGHGGGRITLTAGVLNLDGSIRANGGNGTGPTLGNVAGGGSGGAIRITVPGALSGTGTIQAVGGTGPCTGSTCGGSGSGGRIAIYHCNVYLPAANVFASGGAGARPGAAGTVYFQPTDAPPPTLTVPGPVTAFTGPGVTDCAAIVSDATIGTATAIPHCPGGVTIVREGVPAGNRFPIGTTLITWTATDDHGNSTMATQAITVTDNTAPNIGAPAAIVLPAAAGACDLLASTVSLGSATASDNCSAVTIAHDAPATFPAGPTTVTWTATDSSGNVASATQLVTVTDQQDPIVTAPDTVFAFARATSCDVVVPDDSLGAATAHDNCGGVTVARNGVPSGNLFALGVTTITYTATDAAGRTASAEQIVVVADTTRPVVTPPPDLVLTVGPGNGPCEMSASPGTAQATDNCSVETVVVDVALTGGLALFPEGVTTLTWRATDAAGKAGTATQRVTVRCPVGDITGAVLSCDGATPLAGVTLRLLHAMDLVAEVVTGPTGTYRFDDVRLGTYTLLIVPPPGHAIGIDTRLVHLVDEQQPLAMDPFVLTCSVRGLAGRVTGTCGGQTDGLLGVTVDLYREDGAGDHVLVGTTGTDAHGEFSFDALALGDYTVMVVMPLGYSGAGTQVVSLGPGSDTLVAPTFALACQPITAQPRSMGYWKHQVNVYLTSKGSAQETLAQLLGYIDLMVTHFNQHVVNPVVVYVPGATATNDKLLQLQQLMTVNRGATSLDRAKQQLLPLLLNVVSGKIPQTEVISDNGATVSQAITHSYNLIVDGDPSTDGTAQSLCDLINNGQRVPPGMVPAGIPDYTYEEPPAPHQALPVALGLGPIAPNPAVLDAAISFALPADEPAMLEVVDLAGRMVHREAVGSRGAGFHTIRLSDLGRMPPGVYLIRLSQGRESLIRRLALIR